MITLYLCGWITIVMSLSHLSKYIIKTKIIGTKSNILTIIFELTVKFFNSSSLLNINEESL